MALVTAAEKIRAAESEIRAENEKDLEFGRKKGFVRCAFGQAVP